MKAILILGLCIAAAQCFMTRKRPDFDCDKYCSRYGVKPVCSDKNVSFKNECYLECEWEYKDCDGMCPCNTPDPSPCYCEPEYKPVCTPDGDEDNKCIAECKGKYVIHKGRCW